MTLARFSAAGFLAAYVLVSFSATPNPMLALWRPLLVAVALGIALQLVATAILRDGARAAFAASIVALLATAAWVPLAVVVVAAAWLGIVRWRRRRRAERDLPLTARGLAVPLGVFALAFAIVAAMPVAGWAWTAGGVSQREPRGEAAAGTPDIVVLLVDGYPRSDALLAQWGYDNSAFEAALEAQGFRVAAHSRSNYTSTWASLASLFGGAYLDTLPGLQPAPADPAEQYRRVMLALSGGPMLNALREDGYEIVTIPSPFESATLTGADRILAPPQLTSFELSLVQHSLVGRVVLGLAPGVAFDQHRDRVADTLRLLTDELARASSVPRFVFAHLLAPHAPIVYRADGSPANPSACFPDCSLYGLTTAADWDGIPGQVAAVNRLVLATLESVVAADPQAIVIVVSDHGHRLPGTEVANAFRNFFAARVPGNPDLFGDEVTPVTLIPRLRGLAPAAVPYRGWVSADLEPLSLTPYLGPPP